MPPTSASRPRRPVPSPRRTAAEPHLVLPALAAHDLADPRDRHVIEVERATPEAVHRQRCGQHGEIATTPAIAATHRVARRRAQARD